ncbi:SDR family oxidoreductase [Pseudomonas sp. St316]|uniref:SDR family NAD(P)-dependent oxidoreductase n=1 Tax=Pseudomonas sp. St316 TaxID=2678257 RepID=UPI001BB3ED87|nr:SDR family oxidoreductase [Pseudomonas sp. St316]BBP58636.1 SDR family oxidoreductase [Pseudomonas sp. St316]
MTTTLITGASSGIGAVYARRFAARGHNLVLVARATDRLNVLADQLREQHGVAVEVLTADLTDAVQLGKVAERLRTQPTIDILVNNAGAGLNSSFEQASATDMNKLLQLNVQAPTMLASAAIGEMIKRGSGSIINIASVLALLPEYSPGIYAATKSYVLTFSQSLAAEVNAKGVYIQAVLPAATRTEIYERSGADISKVPDVMEVEDLVDAALVGFDRKELVTIPPVPEASAWEAFEQARGALAQGFSMLSPPRVIGPDCRRPGSTGSHKG